MLINRRRGQLAPSAPLAAALLAALVGGCADGPVPEMRRLNPWVRKAWDEDEQRITTYHRKIKDLAELRQKARACPPPNATKRPAIWPATEGRKSRRAAG